MQALHVIATLITLEISLFYPAQARHRRRRGEKDLAPACKCHRAPVPMMLSSSEQWLDQVWRQAIAPEPVWMKQRPSGFRG